MTDTFIVAYTFNNYFSEVAVTEGMDKVTDDFADHSSVNSSLRNAIINFASVLIL